MKKILKFLKELWITLTPLVEFFIYLTIAFMISKFVEITYMQAILIVFVWFVLNVTRERLQ